jgi:hypothetical protein
MQKVEDFICKNVGGAGNFLILFLVGKTVFYKSCHATKQAKFFQIATNGCSNEKFIKLAMTF